MHLRRLSLVALISLAAVAAEPADKDKDKGGTPPSTKDAKAKPALAVGQDLPGRFHPFNVNGSSRDHFHCVVSQHGFDPMVLLFVRDLEFSDPLKDLLKRLDNACLKNPEVRLGCAVIFLSEDLEEPESGVVKNDDKREELAQKLKDLVGELKLEKVVVCLDSRNDPALEKYALDREAAYTVVLYRKLRVVSFESILRDKLPDRVGDILKQVADKFGAVRK
jgi:hypothetical protein